MASAAFRSWFSQQRRKLRLSRMPFALYIGQGQASLSHLANTAQPTFMTRFVPDDHGYGPTTVSLTGANASSFQLAYQALYLKAGVALVVGDLSVTISAVNNGVTKTQNFVLHVT